MIQFHKFFTKEVNTVYLSVWIMPAYGAFFSGQLWSRETWRMYEGCSDRIHLGPGWVSQSWHCSYWIVLCCGHCAVHCRTLGSTWASKQQQHPSTHPSQSWSPKTFPDFAKCPPRGRGLPNPNPHLPLRITALGWPISHPGLPGTEEFSLWDFQR